MKVKWLAAQLIIIPAFLSSCFAHHMAVVVNKENNVNQVTAAHLAKIFRSEIRKWPDGKVVILVLHRESEGETETLERLNKMSDSEWKALIAAHKDSIQIADTDADVRKIVESTPGAIGLIDVRSIDNSITVVRVDGKLPMESGYLPH